MSEESTRLVKVSADVGVTINLGDFQSLRVGVAAEAAVLHGADTDMDRVEVFIKRRLTKLVKSLGVKSPVDLPVAAAAAGRKVKGRPKGKTKKPKGRKARKGGR